MCLSKEEKDAATKQLCFCSGGYLTKVFAQARGIDVNKRTVTMHSYSLQ